MTTTPLVSIVIPTYNRLARLRRVLAALDRQTCARSDFEVVVVSDGSSDGTDEYLAAPDTALRLVVGTQANGGPAVARNHGIELASAALVLFVDDDIVAAPDLVERHLERHRVAGDDLVVVGPMLSPTDSRLNPWVQWEQAMLYKQYDAMDRGEYTATFRQFYTGNASVPKNRLVEAGGFDPRFRRAEDVELAYRLHQRGVPFLYDRTAIGYHYAERPFDAWLRNAGDYGANDVIFAREKGRDADLSIMSAEFHGRHPLVRVTSRVGVARPAIGRLLTVPLRLAAQAVHRFGFDRASQLPLSVLYNMAYYQGVAAELGGPEHFDASVAGRPAPSGSAA